MISMRFQKIKMLRNLLSSFMRSCEKVQFADFSLISVLFFTQLQLQLAIHKLTHAAYFKILLVINDFRTHKSLASFNSMNSQIKSP